MSSLATRSGKTLSFDLTGTLTTYRFSDLIWFEGLPRLFAEKNALPLNEAREYLKKHYDEVGDEAPEWYDIKYWFKRFNLGNGWRELLENFKSEAEFYPEVEDVLAKLSQKYEMILITNASREFVEIEIEPIKGYFKRLISSVSDFGEVKKTPQFYAKVCRSLGKEPRDLIHVGDHWQFDFIAPRQLGIEAIFLDRSGERKGDFIIHSLSELETKLL